MCMHTHLKEMLRDECSTFLNVLVINFQNQLNNNHGVLVDRSNLDGFIIYWIFFICSEVVNIGDGDRVSHWWHPWACVLFMAFICPPFSTFCFPKVMNTLFLMLSPLWFSLLSHRMEDSELNLLKQWAKRNLSFNKLVILDTRTKVNNRYHLTPDCYRK